MGILLWIGSKFLGLKNLIAKIPWEVWAAIAVGILACLAVMAMDNSQKKYQALVQHNQLLQDQNTALNKRVNDLAELNRHNQEAYNKRLKQEQDARAVAEQERQDAEKRAEHYRSIRDAIKANPDRTPVSPVVRSTVDSLWK